MLVFWLYLSSVAVLIGGELKPSSNAGGQSPPARRHRRESVVVTTTDLEDALDRLFAAPLESFTKERNALVKALRSEGRAEDADRIAGSKKPVLSAWVTNQLAHRHPDDVRALVELQESLESASAERMREGVTERRRLIAALTKKAQGILTGTGRTPTTTVLQRVSQNLLGTSTPEERAAILRGRLSADLDGSGMGMWSMPAVTEEAPSKSTAREERARREAERLEEEARAAENEARELRYAARDAEARASEAKLAADAAQRRAERARVRADAAMERM